MVDFDQRPQPLQPQPLRVDRLRLARKGPAPR